MTPKTNVRIIDIARMAEVSVGTVDRVLHNRGHVSENKRIRVEKVLKEIGYKPNMVARVLASKKKYTFAAIIPTFTPGSYWELVREGINRGLDELSKFNINIRYFYFDQHDKQSFIDTSKELLKKDFDGIIIATLMGEHVIELSQTLDAGEIPYIYIDSNISGQNNYAYFGGDSSASGQVAAKLLLNEIGHDASIFFAHIKLTYSEISVQMKARETGFMQYMQENGYKNKVYHLELDPDNAEESVTRLEAFLREQNEMLQIGGIVLNSRTYELVKLLEMVDPALCKKVKLIGHDAIDSNTEPLKEGKITYLLSQRPGEQGYNALMALGNYRLFNETISKDNYMPIDILIKENVDYYNNHKS
ncbi:substrate-binding domain-containing protein [Dysgonomonas sp. 25]|uniref:substrate-binding domain-containing protein n=1 Tax=Dysgonomonas sp. 25 TaxID=2302933 RepID=UPI0013D0F6E4|nr:substrate-binding domain-containing protein [Dysgonomonas sp. 25]NDV67424.1 LacI family transcriptional regulator [Dysgonomonas sp. 25]